MESSSHAAMNRFLQRLLRHSSLSQAEQQAVCQLRNQSFQVPAKRDLVVPGRMVSHSIIVVDGLLGRFDMMRSGLRQITAIYISGDMVDLDSVIAPTAGWGITALSPSTVLQIAHIDLRQIAVDHPNLALAFWRDTALDASILAKWIVNVGRKDARARIAHLFCEMGMRMERAQLGRREAYPLPMTQEQVGDATGLTPVHVNRTLQSLKADGLVAMKRHMVEVGDWNRLAALAEFTPTFLLHDEAADFYVALPAGNMARERHG